MNLNVMSSNVTLHHITYRAIHNMYFCGWECDPVDVLACTLCRSAFAWVCMLVCECVSMFLCACFLYVSACLYVYCVCHTERRVREIEWERQILAFHVLLFTRVFRTIDIHIQLIVKDTTTQNVLYYSKIQITQLIRPSCNIVQSVIKQLL